MTPNTFLSRQPLSAVLLGLAVLLFAGCGPKAVTPLQRKQAASLVSEANFAVTLRDFPRAEGLLSQAVGICPDTPEYWMTLGTVRRKLDNRSGAKTAYEQALKAARASAKRMPENSQPLLQQIYVLALLGQGDDARATLEKARREHPSDRALRLFAEGNELDRMLADPTFKELAL